MDTSLIKLTLPVALMVVAGCRDGGGGSDSEGTQSNYFPIAVGSTWTTNSNSVLTRTEILADGRLKAHAFDEDIISCMNVITYNNSVLCTKIIQESPGSILTATYSPATILFPVDTTLGSVTTDYSNVTYSYTNCSSRIKDFTAKVTREITVIARETVSVKAGTFSALKLKYKDTYIASNGYTNVFTHYAWYAQDIGPVMSISSDGSTISELISSDLITSVPVSITVLPSTVALSANISKSFYAMVAGTSNTAVTWSVVEFGGGSITSSGVYTAPSRAGTYHVKTTSVADPTKSATVTVTVTATAPFPLGTWVGPRGASFTVTSLYSTNQGAYNSYKGTVTSPDFGAVTVSGNSAATATSQILLGSNFAVNVNYINSSTYVTTVFLFQSSDFNNMNNYSDVTQITGSLIVKSSVPGHSYNETATFVKE